MGGVDEPLKFNLGRRKVVPGFDAAIASMCKVPSTAAVLVVQDRSGACCFSFCGARNGCCVCSWRHVAMSCHSWWFVVPSTQGEIASFVLSSAVGYGDTGSPPMIGPGNALHFDFVELVRCVWCMCVYVYVYVCVCVCVWTNSRASYPVPRIHHSSPWVQFL